MTFADDIVNWLAAQGMGTVAGTLFQGQLPPEPLDAILVVETGGRAFEPVRRVQPLSLQVISRGVSYASARTAAWRVHALLDSPSAPRLMGTTKVIYSKAIQPPFALGQDARQAWRFSCNYEFLVQR
jgi:hypothetical protein